MNVFWRTVKSDGMGKNKTGSTVRGCLNENNANLAETGPETFTPSNRDHSNSHREHRLISQRLCDALDNKVDRIVDKIIARSKKKHESNGHPTKKPVSRLRQMLKQ